MSGRALVSLFALGLDAATGLTLSPTVTTTVSRVPAPRVTLTVRTALSDRPGADRHAGVAGLGEEIDYRYRVANTGNVALHRIGLRTSVRTAGRRGARGTSWRRVR